MNLRDIRTGVRYPCIAVVDMLSGYVEMYQLSEIK